jgi:[acyl-carrier-protein] S-malonyltransferase
MSVSLAYAFPGQGAQKPGMGVSLAEAFPEARAVFDEACDVLSFDLARLCAEGPAEKLTQTDVAQPAILTTSIATLRALEARGLPKASVALGHSLGEFSALVAAGALEFADALRLVRRRGLLMREAGRDRGGAMAAVIGSDAETIERVLGETAQGRVLVAANFNAPDQVVISGEQAAIQDAIEALKAAGARRVIPLEVSGAFHSPVMAPAAEQFAEELDEAPIRNAEVPVIANVDAAPATDAEVIRENLKRQIVSSVRWCGSVEKLRGLGCTTLVEIGAQNILCGMARKIDKELQCVAAWDAESVEACLATIGESR